MRKDVLWNSVGTAMWSFLSLFLLIVVTRVNGIEASGLFSFAFAFAFIMFTIGCYGGRAYQVSDHKNSFSTNQYVSLRILTSSTMVLLTAMFVVLNDYDLQKSMLLFLLVGQRVFDALADVFYGILQKSQHLYISGKSLFYKSLLSLIAFTIVDLLFNNLLLAALTLPLISIVFLLFYDIPQSRKMENFNIGLHLNGGLQILKAAFMPFVIAVLGLVFVNLARYFIDISHPELQGYFGILIMPLSFILLLFSFIFTPAILHLSNQYNEYEFQALHQYILRILGIVLAATSLLCAVAYLIGAPALQALFGVDFSMYVLDIVLVILIGAAVSLTSLFTNVAIIARRFSFTITVYLLSNIALALLCSFTVAQYQIRGAIIAYIIVSTAQACLMALYYLYLTTPYSSSRKS